MSTTAISSSFSTHRRAHSEPTRTPIKWILTGGTLSMDIDEMGVRQKPSAERVLSMAPASIEFDVNPVPLFEGGIDSSQIRSEDINIIVDAVGSSLKEKKIPLITHGTDSLATTGGILSQVFPNQLIIMTGAFHPPKAPHSDAEENIAGAFLVAKSAKELRIPKVPYAVINRKVYLASSLVKLDIECNDNHRGFSSYNGAVGTLENDQEVIWDPSFLQQFEEQRKKALETTEKVRQFVLNSINKHTFSLKPVEMGFINPHTPAPYLHSMLDRLERKESEGLVLCGKLETQKDVIDRIALMKHHFPIFAENVSHKPGHLLSSVKILDPMQPSQIWSKIAVFAGSLSSAKWTSFLKQNIAGEISDKPVEDTLKSETISNNFYETKEVSRGFLIYFQNPSLFRQALISEITRLHTSRKEGKSLELVIEGLGNGHIYIGGDYDPRFLEKQAQTPIDQKLKAAKSILNILEIAKELQIKVTILAAPRDAKPNGSYEVGQKLLQVGVHFANMPGREYLKQ